MNKHNTVAIKSRRQFTRRLRQTIVLFAATVLCATYAATPALTAAQTQGTIMHHAKGTFDVKITPQAHQEGVGDPVVGRLAISKTFSGDLVGNGHGEMLAVRTAVKDSAGYVALEKVVGVMNGRRGSFALQHSGSMNRGASQLSIAIVPDSGTDELTGIAGEMLLDISTGVHHYQFNYQLPSL